MRKIIIFTLIVFLIILILFLLILSIGWWREKQEQVKMGHARPWFPYSRYTEEDIKNFQPVYDGLKLGYTLEELSQAPPFMYYFTEEFVSRIPTKRTPEQTLVLFIERLKENDIKGACEYINPLRKERECETLSNLKKKDMINQLLHDLIKIEVCFKDYVLISFCYLSKDEAGKTWESSMSFIKDVSGNWLIDSIF